MGEVKSSLNNKHRARRLTTRGGNEAEVNVKDNETRPAREEAIAKLDGDQDAEGGKSWTIGDIEACHALDIRLHRHATDLEDKIHAETRKRPKFVTA